MIIIAAPVHVDLVAALHGPCIIDDIIYEEAAENQSSYNLHNAGL